MNIRTAHLPQPVVKLSHRSHKVGIYSINHSQCITWCKALLSDCSPYPAAARARLNVWRRRQTEHDNVGWHQHQLQMRTARRIHVAPHPRTPLSVGEDGMQCSCQVVKQKKTDSVRAHVLNIADNILCTVKEPSVKEGWPYWNHSKLLEALFCRRRRLFFHVCEQIVEKSTVRCVVTVEVVIVVRVLHHFTQLRTPDLMPIARELLGVLVGRSDDTADERTQLLPVGTRVAEHIAAPNHIAVIVFEHRHWRIVPKSTKKQNDAQGLLLQVGAHQHCFCFRKSSLCSIFLGEGGHKRHNVKTATRIVERTRKDHVTLSRPMLHETRLVNKKRPHSERDIRAHVGGDSAKLFCVAKRANTGQIIGGRRDSAHSVWCQRHFAQGKQKRNVHHRDSRSPAKNRFHNQRRSLIDQPPKLTKRFRPHATLCHAHTRANTVPQPCEQSTLRPRAGIAIYKRLCQLLGHVRHALLLRLCKQALLHPPAMKLLQQLCWLDKARRYRELLVHFHVRHQQIQEVVRQLAVS